MIYESILSRAPILAAINVKKITYGDCKISNDNLDEKKTHVVYREQDWDSCDEKNVLVEKHGKETEQIDKPKINTTVRKNLRPFFKTDFFHRKVFVSFIIFIVCYQIMAFFGGCIAYLHFQRVDRDSQSSRTINPVDGSTLISRTHPLPDYGYNAIDYFCPIIAGSNPQTNVLFLLYILIISGCLLQSNQRKGSLIIQQLLHLNSIVFIARTTTVGITGLPQPNPLCVSVQYDQLDNYWEAVEFVVLRAFPPRACGDLMFSGHVACILLAMIILHRNSYFIQKENRNKIVIAGLFLWTIAFVGIYFTIACRSHYSVDVVLAFYMSLLFSDFYFRRSEGLMPSKGLFSRVIFWLEDKEGLKYGKNEDVNNNRLIRIESTSSTGLSSDYSTDTEEPLLNEVRSKFEAYETINNVDASV